MIGEKALKIKPTNPPIFLEVCGVVGLSAKSIDMYILNDSSVGVCFAKEMMARLASHAMLSFLSISR